MRKRRCEPERRAAHGWGARGTKGAVPARTGGARLAGKQLDGPLRRKAGAGGDAPRSARPRAEPRVRAEQGPRAGGGPSAGGTGTPGRRRPRRAGSETSVTASCWHCQV